MKRECKMPTRRTPKARAARFGGFTLMETMLAMVVVGTGVLAIVAAQQAYHQHNDYAQRVGTALLLANEIRELTLGMPLHDPITGDLAWGPEANEPTVFQFDDLDDFDAADSGGAIFSPPIDALRNQIPNMPYWSQHVTVENVLANFINGPATPDNSTDMVRVTCRVLYQRPTDPQPVEITRLTWIRTGGL